MTQYQNPGPRPEDESQQIGSLGSQGVDGVPQGVRPTVTTSRPLAMVSIHESDLLKIQDALIGAYAFHEYRDRMNACLHIAKEVRFSPLTSELGAALDRIRALLQR